MRDFALLLIVLAAVALGLGIGGCGDSGAGSADAATELYTSGLGELLGALSGVSTDAPPWEWNADVTGALELFESALEHDPDHCGALLGSAVTRILSVATDSEFRSILNELFPGERGASRGALLWYSEGPDAAGLMGCLAGSRTDFHLSELQTYLEEEAVPSLQVADERLSRFEELGCSVDLVVIVPAVWPEEPDVVRLEVDVTDALFVHAALDALQAAAHLISSYNADADDGQTRQDLVEEDVDFLVLRSGNHMPATHAELSELGCHLLDAAQALGAEVDTQNDDVVTESEGVLALDEFLGTDALGRLEQLGEDLGYALANGLTLNPATVMPEDPGAPDVDIAVDLIELFQDPIEDLRDYFPTHTWPTPDSMAIERPLSMPDATFDEITPGMSDAAWEEVASWLDGDPFR